MFSVSVSFMLHWAVGNQTFNYANPRRFCYTEITQHNINESWIVN